MKKTIFTIISLSFIGLSAYAQAPIITSANMYNINEEEVRYNADTLGIVPGASGANVTWDFSALKPDSAKDSTIEKFISPGSTPYAGDFPTANYSTASTSGTSYIYLTFSNNTVSLIGFEGQENNMGTTVLVKDVYDKPEIEYAYPLTFNTNQTNNFHALSFIGGVDTSYLYGTQQVTGDAYGTMKIMNQTYTNVLRLHSITKTTDSISIGGFSVTFPTYVESWSYNTPGKKDPILIITTTGSTGPGTMSVTFNLNSKTTSIENPSLVASSLNIYPNPAQNNCILSFSAQNECRANVSIVNQLGQEISTQNIAVQFGKNSIPLDVSGLAKGLYVVGINSGSGMATQRLVVE